MKNYTGCVMKYVMSEDDRFVIAPRFMNHSDIVNFKVKSAGFVSFYIYKDECGNDILGAECFGNSVSLRKKSDEENDSRVISRNMIQG